MRISRRQKQKKQARKNSCDQNNYQTLWLASKWNTCGSNYLKALDERPLFLLYVHFYFNGAMSTFEGGTISRIIEDPISRSGCHYADGTLSNNSIGLPRSPGQLPYPAVRQQQDKRKVARQRWRGGTTKHGNRQLSCLVPFFLHLYLISNCNMWKVYQSSINLHYAWASPRNMFLVIWSLAFRRKWQSLLKPPPHTKYQTLDPRWPEIRESVCEPRFWRISVSLVLRKKEGVNSSPLPSTAFTP